MANDPTSRSTVITKLATSGTKPDTTEQAIMSYTAVTSHHTMAEAFVNELLRVGQKIIPDHKISIEDILSICHIVLDGKQSGATIVEGRHLRGRISEQLSRADRYREPFTIMALKFGTCDEVTYEAIVDSLYERMRQTDLMFMFRSRIVMLLPHTNASASSLLCERINTLLEGVIKPTPKIATLNYPNPEITKRSQVLDWSEDQLRDINL